MARSADFISFQSFGKYLHDNADAIVGRSRVSGDCPVARYLNWSATGQAAWLVSPLACVDHNDPDISFRPPKWLREFIYSFDKEFKAFNYITGREALYVLREHA